MYIPDRAVSLFGNVHLALARLLGLRIVHLVAVEEEHDIRVLLDGTGLTQVRKLRPVITACLDGAGQLGQHHDRAVEFSGELF